MYKWLAGLSAILLALWVQTSLKPTVTVFEFILLFGFVGLLWLAGAPSPTSDDPKPIVSKISSIRGDGWLPLSMTTLAILTMGGAVMRLWPNQGDRLGLWLWAASIICLCIGWWGYGAAAHQTKPALQGVKVERLAIRWEILFFIVILLGAFLVRWHQIDLYPNGMQSDESNNARDALKWLGGAPYTPYSEANEGQATLFTYLIALCFYGFGVSITAMRLAAVICGLLTVASFYVLARAFARPEVALFATTLLAVSRWHLTFSRIAYELILTPLAFIWLFFFLYQGMRSGRVRNFVFAGLALALGFNTYTAFRVAPVGVAVLCLFWLVKNWRCFWPNLGKLGIFACSGLVGLTPLLVYTIQHPQIVMLRTIHISIFSEIKEQGSWEPFWFNLQKYAFMFNVVGDNSSLNNLPGKPMLDTFVAALFILGIIYALWYWRNLKMFLLLAWCLAVLPAGILTVTVETPSARRVIGLLPAIYLFVAIVGDAFWQATATTWRRQLHNKLTGLALAVAILVAFINIRFFFNVQAQDRDVARAFNLVETSVGRYLATLDINNVQVLLDPAFANNGIVDFIGLNKRYAVFDVGQQLPLLPSQAKATLYVLSPANAILQPVFQYFYPTGVWQDQKNNLGDVVFHSFFLTSAQQAQLHGITTTYTTRNSLNASSVTRNEPQIGHRPPPMSPPYHVEWQGALQVKTFNQYEFKVTDSDVFTLTIDNTTLFSHTLTTTLVSTAALALPAGFHNLRLAADITVGRSSAQPHLLWGSPQQMTEVPPAAFFNLKAPVFGLIGTYYPNKEWQGPPQTVQQDLVVAANHTLPDPYSVIWRGKLWAPQSGTYVLGVNSDDGSFLYIDGQLVIDNGGPHGGKYVEQRLPLTAGLHSIEIRYFQDGGSQALQLFWTPPGGAHQPIPVEALLPSDGDVAVQQLTEKVGFAAPTTNAMTITTLAQSTLQPIIVEETQALMLKAAHGPFSQPRSVAIGLNGHAYIIDTGNRRLVAVSPSGDFLFEQQAGSVAFQDLADVAVDATGQVYVLDTGAGHIEQFSTEGKYQALVNLPEETVARARGLFALGSGEIWLANTPNAQVLKLIISSGVQQEIPLPGMQPVDVLVGATGNIFVTESEKHRLVLLSPEGVLKQQQFIATANTVDSPHLAQDRAGNIFLTDPEGARILKLAPNGTLMQQWQLKPKAAGPPVKPIGIAIDRQDRIWIADVSGNRVWVVTQ